MRPVNRSVLVVTVAALALAGCGQTAPTPGVPSPPSTATPSVSPSVSPSVTSTPTESVSPTPDGSASPTPSATQTPSPSASPTKAAGLVLAGDGVGGHKFGTAEAKVEKTLASALGEPDESIQSVSCEFDSGSPWQRSLHYKGLSVVFTAKSAKKSAPRTLASWSLSLGSKLPKGVRIVDDIPLDLSFKQLKAKYPKGKLTDTGLGDGSEIFTLPNGIRFVGVEVPDMVMAGELGYCE